MSENLFNRNPEKSRGRPKRSSALGKEKLLQSALEIFARKSFEGTNIREIAKRAKVDVALISHHFGTKEDLWKAVVNKLKEKFTQKFNENQVFTFEPENLKEKIITFFGYFVDIAIQVPEFSLFISTESIETERLNYLIEKFLRPVKSVVMPVIKKGIEKGVFAKQNEEVLFAMILGSVTNQIANANTLLRFTDLPKNRENWAKEIKHSLIVNFIK